MPNIYELQGTKSEGSLKKIAREARRRRKVAKYGVYKLTKKLPGSFGSKKGG